MKAIVLAAGRGERMRPLSDRVPKPLLQVGGASLLEWQIRRLAAAGIRDIVINVSHLADAIVAAIGTGVSLDVRVRYSYERVALETAGGIVQALEMLGEDAFVAVNADIYCEYDYSVLRRAVEGLPQVRSDWRAYLVLVDNPEHHPHGDFTLGPEAVIGTAAQSRLTFSGIGAYRAELFAGIAAGSRCGLAPLLYAAADEGRVLGEHFRGRWVDVGTPQRLAQLRLALGDTSEGAAEP